MNNILVKVVAQVPNAYEELEFCNNAVIGHYGQTLINIATDPAPC